MTDKERDRRRKIKELNERLDRPSCANCGKPLSIFRFFDSSFVVEKGRTWGYRGENVFCTATCGYFFGLAAYRAKFRLQSARQ